MVVNALELLLKQKRFDLIFKYVFLAQQNEFAHNAYLENIRAFNNFYELNPSDGVPKNSADDFVQSFNNLIQINSYIVIVWQVWKFGKIN